jgi:hypothetical protein
MFRRKFIDRLRNKYQTGGKKEPYISIGGKSINTPINSKVGFGGKISLPFLESIDHGKSATGLRGEIDAAFTRGDRKLASQLESETSVGELPKDMATSPKTWNAAAGLRGYHNRAIGRNRGLSLNSSIGAGLGSGEKHGAFMYQDSEGFGGASYNPGMERNIKPYADANMSLLKHGQHRGSGGTGVSGGINASYGTKFSPNPGLRAGVEGSFGPFKGSLGYDFTNKTPRAGVALNFQKGGWKDTAKWGLKAVKPFLPGAVSKVAGPLGLILGSQTAYASPVVDATTGVNRFTGKQDYTPFGQTPSWGGGSGNVNVADVNQQLSASMAPKINETGGVRKYHEGGMDESRGYGMEHMQEEHHTGGDTGGDTGVGMYGADAGTPGENMEWGAGFNMGGPGFGFKTPYGSYNMLPQKPKNWGDAAGLLMGPAANLTGLAGKAGKAGKNVWNKVKSSFEDGGVRHQTGGTRLPGGEMQPIPGSDAVQFNGQSHDQGGIMVDSQTEVEGGETMDKVNIAKKGGKRDYFFSSHLKEGGRSYADMHKDILADGGSQEEINMLAKMQEVAAGRDPKQVAKLGGLAKYQTGGLNADDYYLGKDVPNLAVDNYQIPSVENKALFGAGAYNNPYDILNQPDLNLTTLEKEAKKDQKEMEENDYVVKTPEQLAYGDELKSLEEQKKIEAAEAEYAKLYNKAKKKADKGRGVPAEAWVGMGAQMLPSMYAFLHKQKKPEDATYTQGFKSPIHSQTVKAQKLDRVNYNDKRSQLSSSIRGANKFIETSGGGPANMANLQATLAKDIMGQMQINAEETKANVAIDNREKQLAQQAALDNVKRSQAASTMNAQLARIEAARRDTIAGSNVTAQNQFEADQELNKMNALTSTAQGIAGGAGDIMSYKANERMAKAIGSEGIYERDIMRDFIGKRAKKDGIPGLCGAGECTDKQVNEYIANKGVFQNTEEE